MKRYLTIFWYLLLFDFKARMTYRWNFLVQMLYGPAYVFIMWLLLKIVYTKTSSLLGWTEAEATILFSTFHTMYSLSILTFINSIRHLLWQGIRQGELDFTLLKPVNTQFLATFSYPEIQQLFLVLGVFSLWLYSLTQVSFHWFNLLLFGGLWLLSFAINYLTLSTYATLGFYVIKAQQVLEIYDKFSDQAQYPTSIYPESIQFVMFTVLPIAFMSFVPVSFLLGRGNFWLLGGMITLLIVLFITNQWAWRRGLQHYSSASS